MSEKYTAVIPESLAISLKLKKGHQIRIDKKIPGFSGFSSNTNRTSYGLDSVLVSADTFRDISEFIDQSIIDKIFVRTKSGFDPAKKPLIS